MRRFLALCLLLAGLQGPASAEELLMVRINRTFPEAMNSLQQVVQDMGYTVARVQRVDVGLTASGFETAEYRIVFIGKSAEIRELSATYPELIPYLPLNIVVFAEGDDTLVLATNPLKLGEFFSQPPLQRYFARWEKDIRSIFEKLGGRP